MRAGSLGTLVTALGAMLLGCRGADPVPVVVPPVPLPDASVSPPALAVPPEPAPAPNVHCGTEAKERCVDSSHALACHRGAWESMSCPGAAGCAAVGGEDVCDQSTGMAEGAVCNLDTDATCAMDGKSLLQCTHSHWRFMAGCLGPRACVVTHKSVTCDNSFAHERDVCREEDDYACSLDGPTALACRSGVFVTASACGGPKGCAVTGTKDTGFKIACDDSLAKLGDPCERANHYSCSTDARAILRCENGHFVRDGACKLREKCLLRAGQIGCY